MRDYISLLLQEKKTKDGTLLLSPPRFDLCGLRECSRCRSSNLFQLLSDKGEYKEAMEVLKKALKLEPATKVRLCG